MGPRKKKNRRKKDRKVVFASEGRAGKIHGRNDGKNP